MEMSQFKGQRPRPSSAVRQRDRIKLPPLPFYSSPLWIRWGSSHWGQLSALSNPLIQMLVSPRNTPDLDTPRKCCTSDLDTPWPRWTGHQSLDLQMLCSFLLHPLEMLPKINGPGGSLGRKAKWNRVPAEPGPRWCRREPPSRGAQQTSHHTAEAAWRIRGGLCLWCWSHGLQVGLVHRWKARLPLFPWVHEAKRPIKIR